MPRYNYEDKDHYVEYREVSWFTRINESIKGIGAGFILIAACFFLLIWNEGQSIVNQVAQQAIPISSSVANSHNVGQLVITSGTINSNETLGDNLFIQPGKYIALARGVDMYGWTEQQHKETQTNVGGSQSQKITTTYRKRWIPLAYFDREKTSYGNTRSASFVHPANHQNPSPSVNNAAYKVNQANIGVFNLDMHSFSLPHSFSVDEAYGKGLLGYVQLPTPTPLQLSSQNIISTKGVTNVGNYLYKGSANLANPNVGDLRMRYAVLNANTQVTVIGKLAANNQIIPYVHRNNHSLYRIFPGTETQALARIKREDHVFTWGLRFLSLIFIWCGLRLIAEPINVVLDFIPIFGSIGRLTTGFSSFLIALILTISTIVIYHITQNLILMAIALPIIFFIGNKLLSKFSPRYR